MIHKPAVPRILGLVLFCYVTIYLVWGSTYYFIKISVISIPPVWVVGLRFICGGLLMFVCSLIFRRWVRFPSLKEWGTICFLGMFLLIGGNLLVTIAEQKVDSYLAALIISCTPIAVALYNRVLFNIRLPLLSGTGIAIGICGVALLLYEGHGLNFSISASIIMLLFALGLWAFATCMSGHMVHYPDVFIDSSLQMAVAGVLCCCIAPWNEGGAWIHTVQPISLYGVLYLIIIGSIAFAAYNYLLLVEPPQRISSYALVNPFVATVIGIVVAREKPVAGLAASLCAIMAGVVLLVYEKMISGWMRKAFVRA